MKKHINPQFLEILNTIVTSDSYIPEHAKKNRKIIVILRTVYLIIIATLVFFSFFSFAIKQKELASIKVIISLTTFFVFLADYILHWLTYPVRNKTKKSNWVKLLIFPFTGVGLILLFSTLASFSVLQYLGLKSYNLFTIFETITLIRLLRLILILKVFTPFRVFINVFKEQRVVLINTFFFIGILIIAFALIIWNNEVNWLDEQITEKLKELNAPVESQEYKKAYQLAYDDMSSGVVTNFLDALYYATITLTTIGYGDFAPHAANSKVVVIIISILGIAVFAIPSGVVAGAVLTQIQDLENSKRKKSIKERE
ncbi:potassium channel family protein [Mycoplasmopsis alligatoris]|uniref:Ion channel n=1 Tax=Mycoplasmopsis alligatoris A21JP2 TaxID=747682 RepID=D4XX33_9BACT|nr:potassium channel family protein [Mycoplasmopsis alligatoris]EFF41090.1 Ion channel [Mycoplasmopsis alligatoris A21JP2]